MTYNGCMAAHQRAFPRIRRRVPLTLGASKTFTHDLSPGGFSAELQQALPQGATVHGALDLGGERYPFTGLVAWSMAGDARILRRARLGVCFTGVPNAFYARCAELFAG